MTAWEWAMAGIAVAMTVAAIALDLYAGWLNRRAHRIDREYQALLAAWSERDSTD